MSNMSTFQPDPPITSETLEFSPIALREVRMSGGLESGDEMPGDEFFARYERTPEDFKAELIDGVVYVASPVSLTHGDPDQLVSLLLGHYRTRTPGVQSAPNTTVFLSAKNIPQPDGFMRILPEFGGQSRTKTSDSIEYLAGPPELVVEISLSTRAIDLHGKLRSYCAHGVLEYLVLCVEERELRWLDLQIDATLQADSDGVMRIKSFPGLWINADAVCKLDFAAAVKTLEAGLASPEHAEFVARLEAQRQKIAAETTKAP